MRHPLRILAPAGCRRRRPTSLVALWAIAAAFLAPINEVGDLLEAVVPVRLRVESVPHHARLGPQAAAAAPAAPAEETGVVLARYIAGLGSAQDLGLILEPLFPLPDEQRLEHPRVLLSWRDPERGPPAPVTL